MILSNFTPIGSVVFLAEVTVTTEFWLWRRVEVKKVFRELGRQYWKFVDTGEYCPGSQCENLEEANKRANIGKEAFARYYEDHR
jgi:hypothetical protein